MIILQVEVANLAEFDVEGQPPIAANRYAQRAGGVSVKLMNPPAGRAGHTGYVRCGDQYGEDIAQPADEIVAKLPAVVGLDET